MSSTAKGDAFETKIYKLFASMIRKGDFLAPSKLCKIFTKKGYYSKDREKEIIFDISIEIYNSPDSDRIAMLYLIECKNYAHPVPVDDSEEFSAKLQQVSAAKGIIASTGAFQAGTIKFCNSKRIGLLRYFTASNVKWELDRSSSAFWVNPGYLGNPVSLYRDLITHEVRSRFDFCGHHLDRSTNSLHDFFRDMAQDAMEPASFARIENRDIPRPSIVDFIEEDAFDRKVGAILTAIAYKDGAVALDEICKWQASSSGLVVKTDLVPSQRELADGILGRLSFNPPQISVFSSGEKNEARQRFTLAHELGHFFLGHQKYMRSEVSQEGDLEPDASALRESREIARLEWQANHFASCLLLPLASLVIDFSDLARRHGLERKRFGFLYADEQPCNLSVYNHITGTLKDKYKVSRTVIKVRLSRLNLITDGFRKDVSLGSAIPHVRRERRETDVE